jgi:soluble P-type ATPase
MATKSVLKEAIRKLEITNMNLRKKLSTAPEDKKNKILEELARNDSMILDFNYRLNL